MTEQLSNWGRWGDDDEIGTLNLLTPDLIKAAAGLIREGVVYSLTMPLDEEGPLWPSRHKTWRTTRYENDPLGAGWADDVVVMHSHAGTHLDVLCHVWYENQLYNGHKVSEHVGSDGSMRNSVEKVPFIVSRGVLLDIAGWKGVPHLQIGESISAADLTACADQQGVAIRAGDVLLVRTGWMRVFETDKGLFNSGEPGLDMTTPAWLQQHDIVAVGADNHAVEVLEMVPPEGIPFHLATIRDLGMYLLENLNLEQLAADGRYEFFFVTAPLPLTNGVGSPINPLAIV